MWLCWRASYTLFCDTRPLIAKEISPRSQLLHRVRMVVSSATLLWEIQTNWRKWQNSQWVGMVWTAPRVWVKLEDMKANSIGDQRTEGSNCEPWPLSPCLGRTLLCWTYSWINEGLLQLVSQIPQGPPGHREWFQWRALVIKLKKLKKKITLAVKWEISFKI